MSKLTKEITFGQVKNGQLFRHGLTTYTKKDKNTATPFAGQEYQLYGFKPSTKVLVE